MIVYLNELSDGGAHAGRPADWAEAVFSALRQLASLEPNVLIGVPALLWHAPSPQGDSLSVWIKGRLQREKYQWLLTKVRITAQEQNLICDVYNNGRKSVGLSMAFLSGTWTISFPVIGSEWLNSTVVATRYCLTESGFLEGACQIRNISTNEHLEHWQDEIRDWGKTVSANNVVGAVSGFDIEMYPLDHGYPHVHVVDRASNRTIAKYRVDEFERLEGDRRLDAEMRLWIENNRPLLLLSWARCESGGHPYAG